MESPTLRIWIIIQAYAAAACRLLPTLECSETL